MPHATSPPQLPHPTAGVPGDPFQTGKTSNRSCGLAVLRRNSALSGPPAPCQAA